MKIDVHAHYWTDDHLDMAAGLGKADTGAQRGRGAGGGDELRARLALMDRAGVDMQVLSACPQRIDNQYASESPDTPETPSIPAKRQWYDTVGHGHVPALRAAIDTFGADRLLLGTDFPYELDDIYVRAVDYISDPSISRDHAELILEMNAAKLFGLGRRGGEAPVA